MILAECISATNTKSNTALETSTLVPGRSLEKVPSKKHSSSSPFWPRWVATTFLGLVLLGSSSVEAYDCPCNPDNPDGFIRSPQGDKRCSILIENPSRCVLLASLKADFSECLCNNNNNSNKKAAEAPSPSIGAAAMVAPTPAATVSRGLGTSTFGYPGCSICGDGMRVSNPDAIITYLGVTGSCSLMEQAGDQGLINFIDCVGIRSNLGPCGCISVTSAPVTNAPVTNAPVTNAPSLSHVPSAMPSSTYPSAEPSPETKIICQLKWSIANDYYCLDTSINRWAAFKCSCPDITGLLGENYGKVEPVVSVSFAVVTDFGVGSGSFVECNIGGTSVIRLQ